MKRFIITNLLAVLALPMLACAWVDSHNYYLYSLYNSDEFSYRVEEICSDNWKAYLGMDKDQWFSFKSRKDDIFKTAQQKGDALMISYVENLSKYLDCVDIEERKQWEWDYPTKEEMDEGQLTLSAIRTYAQGKLTSRLRSQHALLFMRCNMMLGHHQENISFWEQTGSQLIQTVYKDMMKNIYAGALYKTGQDAKAGELFAEMGDYKSLMTLYYKKRSFVAIRQEYMRNPNSAVLPFLLQDFVNNAQEADDISNPNAGGIGGKLFIRNIQKSEALQMRQFCEQVVKDGKTDTPSMWKSAKAWLEYMFGNKKQAMDDIIEAGLLKGTQRMQDNARVLRIYISANVEPQSQDFDNWLEPEIQWLYNKGYGKGSDAHYNRAYDRIVHQTLCKRYTKGGKPEIALALLRSGQSYAYDDAIDTIKVEDLLRYKAYIEKPTHSVFDHFLKQAINDTEVADGQLNLDDLIGTKYMRLCQWDEAVKWLSLVPLSYYNSKGYAVYAVNRRYDIAPWMKRQWIPERIQYSDENWKLTANPKLAFVREVQKMEGELNVLSGDALRKQYYELAIRYAQASFTGDCWFLMRDSKSVIDTVRVNEVDFAAKAASMLQKAGGSHDFLFNEKVLFARSYAYMNNESLWYTLEWNDHTYEYDRKPNPQGAQYLAFTALANFEKKNASRTSSYISRCDEYKQFLKNF